MTYTDAQVILRAARVILRSGLTVYDAVDNIMDDGNFSWTERGQMALTGLRVATNLEALWRELDEANLSEEDIIAGIRMIDAKLAADDAVENFGLQSI